MVRNCRNYAPTLVFVREIVKRQFFIKIEEGSEVMQTARREYTQPRNLKTSQPRGWIRSNGRQHLKEFECDLDKSIIVL